METWRHGDTETRGDGDMETRRHGDTGRWRHGDTGTRRHGDTGIMLAPRLTTSSRNYAIPEKSKIYFKIFGVAE